MIFLRHPTPDVPTGTCYGQTDLDIAEIGHAQIENAVQVTPVVERVIASPALRCQKLAHAIADRHGLKPTFDDRLWEMNMGDFEGKLWAEIDREVSAKWFEDPFHNKAPNGESFLDVQTRVLEALEQADDTCAIVCHAGVIRATQMAWEDKTFKQVFAEMPPYAEPMELFRPLND